MNQQAELIFRQIAYGSNDYRIECDLRNEVLWRPIGISLYDVDLSVEAVQLHFGLFLSEVLIACLVAEPVSASEVKLRQMAVSPNHRGQGYGRRLLGMTEAELAIRGFTTAFLNARVSVVDFYAKSGFESSGSEFLEVRLPHRRMSKRLTI